MEEKKIEVMDITMFYRTAGKGVPVVYVHGNTGSSLWYSRVMAVEGCATWAPDLPNFGNSGRIAVSDIDIYADYLVEWMNAVGLESAVLTGHSLGGAVAMSTALRYPDKVNKLLLVDPSPISGYPPVPEEQYPHIEMLKTSRDIMRQALQGVVPSLEDPVFLDSLTDDAMKMNPDSFLGNVKTLEEFNYSGEGNRYQGEVLVLWGDRDILVTEELARATAAEFPHGEFEKLAGVGHSVMVEKPQLFLKIVREFVLNK